MSMEKHRTNWEGAAVTSRTRLTKAEASSVVRRTVVLSADEARRDGIIEAAPEFALLPGAMRHRQPLDVPVGAPIPGSLR